ncbi:hypothetical protein [[Ruminococcus] lactaris]|uniref:hypothetical protein n=1 Tax=[Ruminococcus] lactaris TaxID=46228 RepID=UPI00265EE94A|nr:hypothetical protein [[Ruminococcus] lactaris]
MVQVIFCYLYHCCFYRERIGKEIKNTENGSPYCFFGVFVDITEQKEHTELEKARDEALRKAENALNAINMLPE